MPPLLKTTLSQPPLPPPPQKKMKPVPFHPIPTRVSGIDVRPGAEEKRRSIGRVWGVIVLPSLPSVAVSVNAIGVGLRHLLY